MRYAQSSIPCVVSLPQLSTVDRALIFSHIQISLSISGCCNPLRCFSPRSHRRASADHPCCFHAYVGQLFENQSVVEYWENFASHAFENSTQSVYSHSVLLKPSGDPVACAFCFTIRRNMFDLPDLIIGKVSPFGVGITSDLAS